MAEGRRNTSSDLPPGFRFHPTDEELIMYYLRNQAISNPCPVSIIPEVNIYKFEPWQLPEKSEFGENEWYFFTPRDRKYPNGVRPNRATASGYWKATGTDKAIQSGSKYVGVKKALVFYKGRPPKGDKTDWIMHEYRLSDSSKKPSRLDGSMKLDDWVLCRIYKKRNLGKTVEERENFNTQNTILTGSDAGEQQNAIFPRTCSLAHLLEADYSSISQFLNDNSFNSMIDLQSGKRNAENENQENENFQSSEMGYHQLARNSMKLQGNQNTLFNNQTIYMNPGFEFQ